MAKIIDGSDGSDQRRKAPRAAVKVSQSSPPDRSAEPAKQATYTFQGHRQRPWLDGVAWEALERLAPKHNGVQAALQLLHARLAPIDGDLSSTIRDAVILWDSTGKLPTRRRAPVEQAPAAPPPLDYEDLIRKGWEERKLWGPGHEDQARAECKTVDELGDYLAGVKPAPPLELLTPSDGSLEAHLYNVEFDDCLRRGLIGDVEAVRKRYPNLEGLRRFRRIAGGRPGSLMSSGLQDEEQAGRRLSNKIASVVVYSKMLRMLGLWAECSMWRKRWSVKRALVVWSVKRARTLITAPLSAAPRTPSLSVLPVASP